MPDHPSPHEPLALVADVGGTNTRVALAQGPRVLAGTVRRYPNAGRADLPSVLRGYMAETGGPAPEAACVAVAGPVQGGRARLTNLDWSINGDALARATGARVTDILNDLQAQGHALGHIAGERMRTVIAAPASKAAQGASAGEGAATAPEASPARLVVNVGTGFNIAPVFDGPGGRVVPAAEAGHASLPVRGDDDRRLARFVERAHGFASIEEVLSGRGVEAVHAWLREEDGGGEPMTAAAIMAAVDDGRDPRARRVAGVLARCLGVVSGDLALSLLPFGGVFLVGGVARALGPHLTAMGFVDAFRDKGRFSGFMEQFAVAVVEDDEAALTGCAAHLARLMGHGRTAAMR